MKNNKGFTMIELLATIVILSVLSTIGIVSLTRYLKQSKERAYKVLSQSIYEAYENCAIQNNCDLPAVGETKTVNWDKIEELVTNGYLDNLNSPSGKDKQCTTGSISITAANHGDKTIDNKSMDDVLSEYIKYEYTVSLTCPGVPKKDYTWPQSKTN